MPDLEQLLREHLHAELARAPKPAADPLPGIAARAAARRRRRGAVTTLVVVATAAAAVTGVAALRDPTVAPRPVVNSPSPSPSSSTASGAGSLLLTAGDLPARVDPADLPLTWTAEPGTGPGTCLTGHLPSGLATAASTDLVAPKTMTSGPGPLPSPDAGPVASYRYREVVLDAGSPAAASNAVAALTARLGACRNVAAAQFAFPGEPGSPYLPTQVAVQGGGIAVLATWPKLPGSNASNDEYVGFTVAGRYLVTLSLAVQEKDQKNLAAVVALPLTRVLTRAGLAAPAPTEPADASVSLTLSLDSPPGSADVTITATATGQVPALVEAPPATGPVITGNADQGLLATRLAWGDGATDGSDPGGAGCRADAPLVPLDIGPLRYQHHYSQPGTYTFTYLLFTCAPGYTGSLGEVASPTQRTLTVTVR